VLLLNVVSLFSSVPRLHFQISQFVLNCTKYGELVFFSSSQNSGFFKTSRSCKTNRRLTFSRMSAPSVGFLWLATLLTEFIELCCVVLCCVLTFIVLCCVVLFRKKTYCLYVQEQICKYVTN
jgi:hypothetical protein